MLSDSPSDWSSDSDDENDGPRPKLTAAADKLSTALDKVGEAESGWSDGDEGGAKYTPTVAQPKGATRDEVAAQSKSEAEDQHKQENIKSSGVLRAYNGKRSDSPLLLSDSDSDWSDSDTEPVDKGTPGFSAKDNKTGVANETESVDPGDTLDKVVAATKDSATEDWSVEGEPSKDLMTTEPPVSNRLDVTRQQSTESAWSDEDPISKQSPVTTTTKPEETMGLSQPPAARQQSLESTWSNDDVSEKVLSSVGKEVVGRPALSQQKSDGSAWSEDEDSIELAAAPRKDLSPQSVLSDGSADVTAVLALAEDIIQPATVGQVQTPQVTSPVLDVIEPNFASPLANSKPHVSSISTCASLSVYSSMLGDIIVYWYVTCANRCTLTFHGSKLQE